MTDIPNLINISKITESQARCAVSDSIRYTLCKMFQHINGIGVSTEMDFSNLSDQELINFGLATAGFLSLQTFETDTIEDREYDKLIGGTFKLRELSREDAERIACIYGAKFSNSKKGLRAKLCKIHDSEYSIISKNSRSALYLTTPEPELHTKTAEPISTLDFFKIIRNSTAHNIYYRNGEDIVYHIKDGYISVPNMWMRGYSELFVRKKSAFNKNEARNILYSELTKNNNHLENETDINKALSYIKHLFDSETLKHFYRVNNFVNTRLKYQPIFFKVKVGDKVEILLNILEKNPNFLKQPNETINPHIIYNLQQIVSRELEKREAKNDIYEESEIGKELDALEKEYDSLSKRLAFLNSQKEVKGSLYLDGLKRCKEVDAKYSALESKIKSHEKLSSSHMDFYNPTDLQYLPIETSFNIIALLAYTDLVTSALYEDTLKNTDYLNLSNEQKKFFSNFEFNDISYVYKGKKYDIKTPTDICFALRAIRNAICHGLISYKLNPLRQEEFASYQDAEITFYSDIEDIQVIGNTKDFFLLLLSNHFTKERSPSVITQNSPLLKTKLEDYPKVKRFIKSDKIKKKDEE